MITILKSIETSFTSDNYDTSNLDKGKDEIIEIEQIKITFTTTQNQKNITNNNMTSLDLGYCETLLREHYNLSNDTILYMKKIDITQNGMKIPKIEFDVYSKISSSKLEKLNLSICQDSKMSLSIPINITENLDKLNTSSDYFNDICYQSTSESGTDITLSDRKKDFVDNNKTVCQENCDLDNYDYDLSRANCSCAIKESSDSFFDMNINKDKLYEKFGETNNKMDISNLKVTSCNVLSSKENIESNAGFYSLLIIVVAFVVVFIVFCRKGYNSLEEKIDEVIYKKFKEETKNKNNKKNGIKNSIINQGRIQSNQNIKIKTKRRTRKKESHSKRDINSNNNFLNQRNNKSITLNDISSTNGIKKNKPIDSRDKFKKSKPDTDYELNWLSYKEAIIYDKRTKCEYYSSLIRSKQLFIFTFCTLNDYNSGIIKKFIFFLSFALHYTTNALFFNESTMHQIYEDSGKYNFNYQIPYIIYSAITFILRLMLQFLVLTDKDVLEVKNQTKRGLAIDMKKKKLKYIKIKFGIFFILNFILLVLFWYYLTCFNAIYKNTQVYLIENTFISLGFSLFYPFIINIFPTMIRICSLRSENKDKEYFYKVSQIIQIV